jgi:hypothetical protein
MREERYERTKRMEIESAHGASKYWRGLVLTVSPAPSQSLLSVILSRCGSLPALRESAQLGGLAQIPGIVMCEDVASAMLAQTH